MTSALDVARFFVDRGTNDPKLTHLKLQKLVYYAQAWSMVFFGKPLFDESVEAWSNGPAVYLVWKEFNCYGKNLIRDYEYSQASFGPEQRQILDLVWEKYGFFSANELWALSHLEAPWIEARGDIPLIEKSREEIPLESMNSYFSRFGGWVNEKPHINSEVLSSRKGNSMFNICMTDGSVKSVDVHHLGEFISNNIGQIELIPADVPKIRRAG